MSNAIQVIVKMAIGMQVRMRFWAGDGSSILAYDVSLY